MAIFLSDEWFTEVDRLTTKAGDLALPESLQALCLNLVVTETSTSKECVEMNLHAGRLSRGLSEHATVQLSLNQALFRKIFFEFDTLAAMTAFMMGKIKVTGDMSALAALQSAKPSPEQKALFKQILAMSES